MIQATDNRLLISINDTAPNERRQWIIKALTAAVRWYPSSADAHYERDGENLTVLAQLLEEMIDTRPSGD